MLNDVRYALRSFRRQPIFVAGVVSTFALAIGANAAIFGLLERLMLSPPPGLRDAGGLGRLQLSYAVEGGGPAFTMSTTSYPDFQVVSSLGTAFSAVTAFRPDTVTLGRGADLTEVAAVAASGDYFSTLGVRPAIGRFFGPADDALPDGNDVVVLGFAFWQRTFAGDAGAIGRELIVDDRPLTIIGVAPRGFNGTDLGVTDLFLPLTTSMRGQSPGWSSSPGMRLVFIVARIREGVGRTAAGGMVAAALRGDIDTGADRLSGASLESLIPGRSGRQSAQARIALWLSGVSLVVLLIATANVGTLLLLRAARRRREVAVRLSLGAGRARLVRQMLVESVILALAGAVVGVVMARWFGDIVRVTLLPGLAPSERIIDQRVLFVSLAAAVAAGILAGLSPLAQLGRRNLSIDLRAGGGQGSSGRFVLQHALVGLQVALCMVLLVGAGLFVRSLDRVRSQDLGFSTARLLYLTLDFRGALRGPDSDLAHEEAVRRIVTVPGVTAATVVQGMPFSSHHIPPINIPGYDMPPPNVQQMPIMYGATASYLAMMGVTLLEGRLITDADGRGAPWVVLVNETMARTVWPGQTAIGKCIRAGHTSPFAEDPMSAAATLPCRQVVGVVRDSRARSLRTEGDEARLMQYYVPFPQLPSPPFASASAVHAILVQTAGDPRKVAGAVQRIVQGTSPAPVYARARPYQDLIDPQLRSWRLGATLFSALGALAVGIAAVGLFAVVSYLVSQRTQEIGVRLALGGTGAAVARLVVRDALRMAGLGAGAGLVMALAGAPALQPLLFQTAGRDATILLAAAGMLLGVTLAAAAIPAWRASGVSAMQALRTDG